MPDNLFVWMNMGKTNYYSTNMHCDDVDFERALFLGLAPDKGLFMPRKLPSFSSDEIEAMKRMEYDEIAYVVLKRIIGDDVDDLALRRITKDAYNFRVPIEKVTDKDHIMRLDCGPTASFKDFAARMMARLMQYFMKKKDMEITILTATSGDTGSAVAQAFFGLSNIRVVVLFPKDEVSERQRRQMTTLSGNITAIAVDGKFDDCQAMVKEAFSDPDLLGINLTSANSINIGRLIPQSIYYFYAYSRVARDGEEIVFSVPSGNFGDLMGGLFAKKMGLPVARFIAAVNENNEFPVFLETGEYAKISPSRNCVSNAMNVGHPSNLARLVALYGGQMDERGMINKMPDMNAMRSDVFSLSVLDDETRDVIKRVYEKYKVVLEPHGAVG
ncbi:MAG: threonine synthase [archaeon]